MKQLRLFKLLLEPSLFSFIFSLVLSLALLGGAYWSYVTDNSIVRDYLFGTAGLITSLQESKNLIGSMIGAFTAFSAQYMTYEVILFFVAVAASIIIYVVARSIEKAYSSTNSALHEIYGAGQGSRGQAALSIIARFFIRFLSLAAWFFYWIFSIKFILPFGILLFNTGLQGFPMWIDIRSWLYCLTALGLLLTGIHLHVIFMRLIALRPRLFGSRDAILDAIHS